MFCPALEFYDEEEIEAVGEKKPNSAFYAAHSPSSFESPKSSITQNLSLLKDPIPDDLFTTPSPNTHTFNNMLNITINNQQLFQSVQQVVQQIIKPESTTTNEPTTAINSSSSSSSVLSKSLFPSPAHLNSNSESFISVGCSIPGFSAPQQQSLLATLRNSLSSLPQQVEINENKLNLAISRINSSTLLAHRYRLYTDNLIRQGLHHEHELTIQWCLMEAQARAMNRSAERAAIKDMKDNLKEYLICFNSGKTQEVQDKEREIRQHLEEANAARLSRKSIYSNSSLCLPPSKLQQKLDKIQRMQNGEKAVTMIGTREPLFDPTTQINEFHSEVTGNTAINATSTKVHPAFHVFRPQSPKSDLLALPPAVQKLKRQLSQRQQQQQQQQQQQSSLHTGADTTRKPIKSQQSRQTEDKTDLKSDLVHSQTWPPTAETDPILTKIKAGPLTANTLARPSSTCSTFSRPSTSACSRSSVVKTQSRPRTAAPPPHIQKKRIERPSLSTIETAMSSVRFPSQSLSVNNTSSKSSLPNQRQGSALLQDICLFSIKAAQSAELREIKEREEAAQRDKQMKDEWIAQEKQEVLSIQQQRLKVQSLQRNSQVRREEEEKTEQKLNEEEGFHASSAQKNSQTPPDLPHESEISSSGSSIFRSKSSSPSSSSLSSSPSYFSAHHGGISVSLSPTSSQHKSTLADPDSITLNTLGTDAVCCNSSSAFLSKQPETGSKRPSTVLTVNRRFTLLSGFNPHHSHHRSPSTISTLSLVNVNVRPGSSKDQQQTHLPIIPSAQVKSRWESGTGRSGKDQLARRFSQVIHQAETVQTQQKSQQQQQQQTVPHTQNRTVDSTVVASAYSHDPLHSPYLQEQRIKRAAARGQVYETVKKWLEQQEEKKMSFPHSPFQAQSENNQKTGNRQQQQKRGRGNRQSTLNTSPFMINSSSDFDDYSSSSYLSPRSRHRQLLMQQQLPVSVSNPAVFAWMKKHSIIPRRSINPSEEVKYRQMFSELDEDHSGLLDESELIAALHYTHGLSLTSAELTLLFNAMDINFNGNLSFQQFVSQFASMDEWEAMFKLWGLRKKQRQDREIKKEKEKQQQQQEQQTQITVTGIADDPIIIPDLPVDVDVLVPFLLWVPAFHRLKLLDSLMQLQLTTEEEAGLKSATAEQSSTDSHQNGNTSNSSSISNGSSGLSLIDLWRVTRIQVRRKRLEADRVEKSRIQQMQQQQLLQHSEQTHSIQYHNTTSHEIADINNQQLSPLDDVFREIAEERLRRKAEKQHRQQTQNTSKKQEKEEGEDGRQPNPTAAVDLTTITSNSAGVERNTLYTSSNNGSAFNLFVKAMSGSWVEEQQDHDSSIDTIGIQYPQLC